MSIVLEALEKAQKEKDRVEAQLLSQKKLEAEKYPAKIEEHMDSKPDIEKVLEKEQGTKTRLVSPPRPGFHKKFFVIVFILVIVNLFLIGWWLNYNNSIVYDDSSGGSHVSTSQVKQDIPVLSLPKFILEATTPADIIEKLPPLNVNGVVWDEKDPIVLVNGRFLKKGDEIIGAKVIDIKLHEVKFLYKDKEFTVSVE